MVILYAVLFKQIDKLITKASLAVMFLLALNVCNGLLRL